MNQKVTSFFIITSLLLLNLSYCINPIKAQQKIIQLYDKVPPGSESWNWDGQMVYPGFPYGLEGEPGSWDIWIAGSKKMPSIHYTLATEMFKYLIFNNPSWDYSKYDFKNFFEETRYASSYLDATSIDYSDFKRNNGKMILYHGWNDPALSAFATIQHYDDAVKMDKDLKSYIRLFLLPGVLHCGGGTGPDYVDWVKIIEDWTENNKSPERIILSKIENGKTVMTRPVYPYPEVAAYKGKGNPANEKNFELKMNQNNMNENKLTPFPGISIHISFSIFRTNMSIDPT